MPGEDRRPVSALARLSGGDYPGKLRWQISSTGWAEATGSLAGGSRLRITRDVSAFAEQRQHGDDEDDGCYQQSQRSDGGDPDLTPLEASMNQRARPAAKACVVGKAMAMGRRIQGRAWIG